MKIKSIFKLIFFSSFGILLRIIFYYSEYKDYLKSLLIFDQAPYSFDNIKENYIYNLFHKISVKSTNTYDFSNNTNNNSISDINYYSDYNFISKPIAILYKYIKNIQKEYIFIFFIICDLLIAYIISTFKYNCISDSSNIINIIELKEENDNDKNDENDEFNSGVFWEYFVFIYAIQYQ